jgi:hypothetical protein
MGSQPVESLQRGQKGFKFLAASVAALQVALL